VVVRGGDLDPEVLRTDAERYRSIYGDYGLSVFAARDVGVDELAQRAPLVRFEVLPLVWVDVLRAAGFRLDATGRNPDHFTVVFDDLETDIEALRNGEHRSWVYPYHEH
jgi:hypothetical protein